MVGLVIGALGVLCALAGLFVVNGVSVEFLGIILGLFSFVRARFVDVNPFIGIAVGIAVFTSVIAANIIGSILPLVLKKLKIDPAISAGPFITTIIDVTSLILYFEIAQTIFNFRL